MSFWGAYALKLASVALLLAGLYALARALRRLRLRDGGSRLVAVVESTMLSPHLSVHVVRIGTRYFCVGGGDDAGLATLAELTPEEVGDCRYSERSRDCDGVERRRA